MLWSRPSTPGAPAKGSRTILTEAHSTLASGLNLVTAVVVPWDIVYLERAVSALREHGQVVEETLLQYLSPLGWEHINLTGDDLWRSSAKLKQGKYRPLRPFAGA